MATPIKPTPLTPQAPIREQELGYYELLFLGRPTSEQDGSSRLPTSLQHDQH